MEKCPHGRRRSRCKQCGGSEICEHGRQRSRCKECGGASICEHSKRRSECKICEGSQICEHSKRRSQCKQCEGSQICEHDRQRSQCKECAGGSICEHSKRRSQCKQCKGCQICEHNRQPLQCIKCTPSIACQNCHYVYVNKKYRFHPYCFSCYCVLHPEIDIPRQYKIKENYVRDYLKEEFKEQITMIFDKKVADGCSNRRPDVLVDFGQYVLIVECDENEHRGYSCETKRMMQLLVDCGSRPIIFLRFNPDSYEQDGKRYKGCFTPTKTVGLKVDEKEFKRRMEKIVERIEYFRSNAPEKECTEEFFFYSR